jgi:hypothetical protein
MKTTKATIKLFKAVPIKKKITKKASKFQKEILENTISKGYIFAPEVFGNYTNVELVQLITFIDVSLDGEQLNATFHKSWNKVKTASMEQLVMEQIVHYITTYGFEALGIYDKNSVFMPNETLNVPDLKPEELKLIVIRGYTKDELKEKVLQMLYSGVALKEETINDIIEVSALFDITDEEVFNIKNKEIKMIMYDNMNIIPPKPTEFLRYLVYKTTDKTLLISWDM